MTSVPMQPVLRRPERVNLMEKCATVLAATFFRLFRNVPVFFHWAG
jgi:hypothetical protein